MLLIKELKFNGIMAQFLFVRFLFDGGLMISPSSFTFTVKFLHNSSTLST